VANHSADQANQPIPNSGARQPQPPRKRKHGLAAKCRQSKRVLESKGAVNASLQANYIDRKKVYQKSYFSSLHQQSGKSTTEIISQQHCLWGRTSQDLKSASNERHIENWRYS